MPRLVLPTVQTLREKSKDILIPLVSIVVIVALSFTFGKGLVADIFKSQDEIKALKAEREILKIKKEKLSGLDTNILNSQVRVAVVAIPTENSTLSALSSVRTSAFQKNVIVSGIRVGEREGGSKGAKEVSLGFELEGSLENVLALLDSISSSAPVMRLNKAKLVGSSGSLSANLDLLSFWGDAPKNLPAVNTPFEGLSSKDQELLNQLEQLKTLGNATSVVPAPAEGRENPFQ